MRVRIVAASIASLLMTAAMAAAQTVDLSWDASSTPGLSAYVVEWGTAPGDHRASALVGADVTAFETPPLRVGFRYYFVVRAIDADGVRSAPSNEVPVVVRPGRTEAGRAVAAADGLPTRVLSVRVVGNGAVAGPPAMATCEAACHAELPAGTAFVLAASPASGHRFVRWIGAGCNTATTCTGTLATSTEVVAEFEPAPSLAGESRHRRYLAEGAAGDFFDTRIALANPGARPAEATVHFQRGDGVVVPIRAVVAPLATHAIETAQVDGLYDSAFSTIVDSDMPLVVDRTMQWHLPGAPAHGSHAESSVPAPASRWYLAEGSTLGGFDLFYLLQNPGPEPVVATIRYLRPHAPPLDKTYWLPPTSRTSIWVNQETFDDHGGATLLADSEVSAVIETSDGAAIVVERAMYDTRGEQTFTAGHESAGLTRSASRWYLAEGATGPFFDLFVLIANPGSRDADVTITYLLPDGTQLTRVHRVPASERYTVWVDQEAPRLADTAVSMTIESADGVPIVVERSMWWPGDSRTWQEAHNAPGVLEPGRAWAVADGQSWSGDLSSTTYLLVVNPDEAAARVRVTLLFRDGQPPVSREFGVAGGSRFGIDVGEAFPEARNASFGALVESLADGPPIVVERAMYGDAAGVPWAAGSSLVATRLR